VKKESKIKENSIKRDHPTRRSRVGSPIRPPLELAPSSRVHAASTSVVLQARVISCIGEFKHRDSAAVIDRPNHTRLCRAQVPSEAQSVRGRRRCRLSRGCCPRLSSSSRRLRCLACRCWCRRRPLAAYGCRLLRRWWVACPSSKATTCARQ
jgi:hypothetical protein